MKRFLASQRSWRTSFRSYVRANFPENPCIRIFWFFVFAFSQKIRKWRLFGQKWSTMDPHIFFENCALEFPHFCCRKPSLWSQKNITPLVFRRNCKKNWHKKYLEGKNRPFTLPTFLPPSPHTWNKTWWYIHQHPGIVWGGGLSKAPKNA